jgi:hypothetical protein
MKIREYFDTLDTEQLEQIKELIDRIHRLRKEYEDVVRERQRDKNYQGWCNESIRLDTINEILQSDRITSGVDGQ